MCHQLQELFAKLTRHSDVTGFSVRHCETYDVLGWFAPVKIKVKILQVVWESKVDWDEEVPEHICAGWPLWRSQLKSLLQVHIPWCYFSKDVEVVVIQLRGFSDAS